MLRKLKCVVISQDNCDKVFHFLKTFLRGNMSAKCLPTQTLL
jgi:hypothetical protein